MTALAGTVRPTPACTSSKALTNMPGRSVQFGFGMSMRTRAVRFVESIIGSMTAISPSNAWSPKAGAVTVILRPVARSGSSFSKKSAHTHTVDKSIMLMSGSPTLTLMPWRAGTIATMPSKGDRSMSSSDALRVFSIAAISSSPTFQSRRRRLADSIIRPVERRMASDAAPSRERSSSMNSCPVVSKSGL